MKVKIITPPNALNTKNLLSERLYKLSELLAKINPKNQTHGLLGGEFGYGQKFENSIFKMEPYCWCAQENCNMCNGDGSNFIFKPTKFCLNWYKWIGRSMEFEPQNISDKEINKMFDLCEKSIRN